MTQLPYREPNTAEEPMAAFSCVHVVKEGRPIRSVTRHSPEHPQDSGLIMTCGLVADHPPRDLLIVGVDSWCRIDPSLKPLIEMPLDYWAHRDRPDEDWQFEPL
jgi:hypothetical protein